MITAPVLPRLSSDSSFATAHNHAERQRLKRAVTNGTAIRMDRGLYAINPDLFTAHHELAAVAARKPDAVIGLESAAHYHNLTTTRPTAVQFGIPRRAHPPRWKWPDIQPITMVMTIGGIETHDIEGIPVRITTPARTVAECLAFSHLVDEHTFQEIIWSYCTGSRESTGKKYAVSELMDYAQKLRVAETMRIYVTTIQGP
jgi:predicted transcriptional regulator of viral defense system